MNEMLEQKLPKIDVLELEIEKNQKETYGCAHGLSADFQNLKEMVVAIKEKQTLDNGKSDKQADLNEFLL